MNPASKMSHDETTIALESQNLRPENMRVLGPDDERPDYEHTGEGFPDMR